VALLFSIYMVKPSPFCLLDELDAALDDSNIHRFIRVLKGFLNQSQFLVITHNRSTIGAAGTLYGVTMEADKVSRIMSMRFKEHHHALAGGEAAAQLAPATPVATATTAATATPAEPDAPVAPITEVASATAVSHDAGDIQPANAPHEEDREPVTAEKPPADESSPDTPA